MAQNTQNAMSMNFGAPKTKVHGVFVEIWRDGLAGSCYASWDAKWGNGRGTWIDMRGHAFNEKLILRWRALSGHTQARLRKDEAEHMKRMAA